MRLFIALDLEPLHAYFQELQQLLPKEAKYNLNKHSHLTLQFLGEVPEEKVFKIKETLQEIYFEPITITLSEFGWFPSAKRVNVIWIGIKKPEPVIQLQQRIEEKLKPLGFASDKKFHPHITLARVKFVKNKQGFLAGLKQIKIEQHEMELKEFKLMHSVLKPDGPEYATLATFS